jgi:hypothetical protein
MPHLAAGFWAVSPAWAKCERLHTDVQARIQEAKTEKKEPQVLAQARQCTDEGMKQHRQGQHWASMPIMRRCVAMLEE